jgi:Zn finger protein HypA/HybF involved in hydrogenase expression
MKKNVGKKVQQGFTPETIQAARTALDAYEQAVKAAYELIAAGGLVRGLGSTIMQGEAHYRCDKEKFTCAECGSHSVALYQDHEDWKYCPQCGCEILRWASGRVKPNSETSTFVIESIASK